MEDRIWERLLPDADVSSGIYPQQPRSIQRNIPTPPVPTHKIQHVCLLVESPSLPTPLSLARKIKRTYAGPRTIAKTPSTPTCSPERDNSPCGGIGNGYETSLPEAADAGPESEMVVASEGGVKGYPVFVTVEDPIDEALLRLFEDPVDDALLRLFDDARHTYHSCVGAITDGLLVQKS